jgi:hypothetical protein
VGERLVGFVGHHKTCFWMYHHSTPEQCSEDRTLPAMRAFSADVLESNMSQASCASKTPS